MQAAPSGSLSLGWPRRHAVKSKRLAILHDSQALMTWG